MTIAKDVQKIESELRKYIAHMASQNKTPSCLYLTTAQVEKFKKQAKRDGFEWIPVFDGHPIKTWNP